MLLQVQQRSAKQGGGIIEFVKEKKKREKDQQCRPPITTQMTCLTMGL